MPLNKNPLTPEEAYQKAASFCAYQERSITEVENKLQNLGIYGDERDKIIDRLIQSNYLNEERFIENYIRGKFEIKNWGKQKITTGLIQKGISTHTIKKYLNQIDEERYRSTLQKVVLQKKATLKDTDTQQAKAKVYRFAASRGFEHALVMESLEEIF